MASETTYKKLSKYSKNALVKVICEENFSRLHYILLRLKDIEFDEMVAARDEAMDKWMDKKLTLNQYKLGSKEYLAAAKEIYSFERKIENLCNKIESALKKMKIDNGEDEDDNE